MRWNPQFEQACAVRLVAELVERLGLADRLRVERVWVTPNGKTKFEFLPIGEGTFYRGRASRYGRRPGLELDWHDGVGDVDAWQNAGDVVSGLAHGWQIFKKWVTHKEEPPSKLLRVVSQAALAEVRAQDAETAT